MNGPRKPQQVSLGRFLVLLGEQGIAVVDYDPAELRQELAAFNAPK